MAGLDEVIGPAAKQPQRVQLAAAKESLVGAAREDYAFVLQVSELSLIG